MKVFIERTNEHKDVRAGTVRDILAMLGLNPTTVLVAKNGQLVTEQAVLDEKDEVKILSVISGG